MVANQAQKRVTNSAWYEVRTVSPRQRGFRGQGWPAAWGRFFMEIFANPLNRVGIACVGALLVLLLVVTVVGYLL